MGYLPAQFVRNGWLVSLGSLVLTGLLWACVFFRGGLA
jgi:succinate dehydrogenase / fumarate reductase cytochrome b subunit